MVISSRFKTLFAVVASHAAALCCDADVVLSGNEGWSGIPAHPALLNPACGYPDGTVLSLAGTWEFAAFSGFTSSSMRKPRPGSFYRMDDWRNGVSGKRPAIAPRSIQVPGAWEAQGVGEQGMSDCWVMSDNSRMPLRNVFMGEGWYRRFIVIPHDWNGRRIWLKIGGVRGEAHVWVNDNRIALVNDYCATRKFEITQFVKAGEKAKVVFQIDNRAATSSGCVVNRNKWGGFIRAPELEATPQFLIDDVWVRGDFDRKEAVVKVAFETPVAASDGTNKRKISVKIDGTTSEKELQPDCRHAQLRVPLPVFRPWSPANPNLYTAKVDLVENGTVVQTRMERFGVRKLEVSGSDFLLNGEPFYMRGFGDDAVYPLDGMTVGDRTFHRAHLEKAKTAGFNQIRLHTHCETPEYFDAADEIGLLILAELPYYGDQTTEYGPYDPVKHLTELHANYRRHPSFAIYGMGNEGSHGEWMDRKLYETAKRLDPDRLAISQSGYAEDAGADRADYEAAHQWKWEGYNGKRIFGDVDRSRPFTVHEYLNLCIKTDYRTEKDYTGVWLAPETTARRAAFMARFGLGMEWGERLQDAQIALQKTWQKDGIEKVRMDKDCDGFCFWTLVDVVVYNKKADAFSAQGLLDPFWRPKHGGFTPEEFATFNSPSCVLLSLGITNRVYMSGERIRADILFANYGNGTLDDAKTKWKMYDSKGTILASETCDIGRCVAGPVRKVATLDFVAPAVTSPCRVTFTASVSGKANGGVVEQSNSWSFWIFPENSFAKVMAKAKRLGVTVAEEGSAMAQEAIARQKPAVIVGETGKIPNIKLGWWWMGPQMGTAFKNDEAFSRFPHEGFLSPLQFRIFGEGKPLPVNGFSESDLLVVSEGGECCYCNLAAHRLPAGGRMFNSWGLDLLCGLPEANALLESLIESAASGR